MAFHLVQPFPFSPITPDEDLARLGEVTAKKIRADIQEAMSISFPSVARLAIETSRIACRIVEVDLAILARQTKALDQFRCGKVKARELVLRRVVRLPAKLN